jgi:hypothetical protein
MVTQVSRVGLFVGLPLLYFAAMGIVAGLMNWYWLEQPSVWGMPFGFWTIIFAWLVLIGIGFVEPISTNRFWHRLKTACRAIASSPAAQ